MRLIARQLSVCAARDKVYFLVSRLKQQVVAFYTFLFRIKSNGIVAGDKLSEFARLVARSIKMNNLYAFLISIVTFTIGIKYASGGMATAAAHNSHDCLRSAASLPIYAIASIFLLCACNMPYYDVAIC